MMTLRNAMQLFCDHLERAYTGDIEGDVVHNLSPDFVLLTTYCVFRGHDDVSAAAKLLYD